ncbi:MAG: MtrB/PioB family decaheme-associated outer membrane protein [Gallionella sp.]|nr:MtrB/PioB family decaheme-associated outer membrane protein [Gallionella sp.]
MKHTIEKRFNRTVLAASIAAIGFSAPLVAQADESDDDIRSLTRPGSQIEIGAGHVSEGSYKFGDYGRGMQRRGEHLIGNLNVSNRGDNNASYLEIVGRNLGLDSRDIRIKAGEQGNYGLSFEYDELHKLHSDTYQTPYNGMGSAVLTAPAGWAGTIDTTPSTLAINAPVAATVVSTAMMTALAANMKRFNVETQRKAAAFGLTKQLDGGWDLAVNAKRENKDGTKLTGVPLQIAGGGSRGTLLAPEPINYTTDLYDVMARYTSEKLQAQISYHVSLFKNDNQSLTFDNLFYNAASNTGGNMLTGRLGQMPDNQFHQFGISGGYTLSKETRLTGNLSLGRMKQNDAFLPYITTAGILAAPPVASLNGRIDNTHADIKLHTKLTHATVLTAGLKYDDRDNRTPINQYAYDPADNTNAAGYANSATQGQLRRNTPLSKTQKAFYADMDFELSEITKLKVGYDYDKVTHTYEPTAGDHEHTLKAEIKHNFSDTASGGLAYAHSDRNADPYVGADALMGTYTSVYLATLCVAPNTFVYNGTTVACTGAVSATGYTTPFLDTPAIRKFFLADRKRDKLRAYGSAAASETLDLQFGASYYKEKYPDTEAGFGLTKATGWTANVDANWAATEAVSGVFFASYEDYKTDQNGHHNAGGAPTNLDRQNNTAAFDVRTGTITRKDRSLTAGVGFKVKQNDSFDWGGDFTHANTVGSTGFAVHPTLVALGTVGLPMLDVTSRLNRLELFGKYKVQKNMVLNVGYAHERYSSADWAWDGQTLTSSAAFIGSGQTSPDYKVNVIGASLSYKF